MRSDWHARPDKSAARASGVAVAGDTVVVERRLIFGGSVERRPNMRGGDCRCVSLNIHVQKTWRSEAS